MWNLKTANAYYRNSFHKSKGLDLRQADFHVAIIEENKLESHRGHFYDFLYHQQGTIIHIGNPEFADDKEGGYSAGNIINWNYQQDNVNLKDGTCENENESSEFDHQFNFQFLNQFKSDINNLIKIALDKSPTKNAFFLTDYQFGPEEAKIERIYSIDLFWSLHDSQGLRFNTLYELNEV